MDAGFQALGFAFGNTAYTIGLRRGLSGGIKTSIIPFGSVHEMLMIGTSSKKSTAAATESDKIITSGMSNIELQMVVRRLVQPKQSCLPVGQILYALEFCFWQIRIYPPDFNLALL